MKLLGTVGLVASGLAIFWLSTPVVAIGIERDTEPVLADPGTPGGGAITQLIPFQGFLTDAAGAPVGFPLPVNRNMEFRIYNAPAAGAVLWGAEAHPAVTVDQGVFSVELGRFIGMPVAIFETSANDLWLEVRVLPDPPLSPRTRLGASPFAMRAAIADVADVAIAADTDWVISGSNIYRTIGRVGIGTTTPEALLHVEGTHQIGSSTTNGFLSMYANTVETHRLSSDGFGAAYFQDDETGATIARLWGDGAGTGGELSIYRNATGSIGFQVGNSAEEPILTMSGSARSASINLGVAGNGSVALPTDAISADERLDEPGGAAVWNSAGVVLTGALDVIISRSITPPADGYILAMGGAYMDTHHAVGTPDIAIIGLSNDGALGGAQDVNYELPGVLPTGEYDIPVQFSAYFPATGGVATTIELLADEALGNIDVRDISLNLLYVPSAYGTLSTQRTIPGLDISDAATRSPLTPAEIAAEKRESVRDNDARIEQELTAMKARLADLELELASRER